MKKYGRVNNQKSLDEIQEAIIVSAPIFRKKAQKSKIALIAGWGVYYLITWMITTMLLWAIGAEEKFIEARTPIWVSSWLIPSIPFSICSVAAA